MTGSSFLRRSSSPRFPWRRSSWVTRRSSRGTACRAAWARSPRFSADLTAVWASAPDVVAALWTSNPASEGELYPGLTIFLIALAGAVIAWRTHRSGRWPACAGRSALAVFLVAGIALILAIARCVDDESAGRGTSRSAARARPVPHGRAAADRARVLGSSGDRPVAAAVGAVLLCRERRRHAPVRARARRPRRWFPVPLSDAVFLVDGIAWRRRAASTRRGSACSSRCVSARRRRSDSAGSRLAGATKLVAAVLTAAIYIEGWVPRFPVMAVPPTSISNRCARNFRCSSFRSPRASRTAKPCCGRRVTIIRCSTAPAATRRLTTR